MRTSPAIRAAAGDPVCLPRGLTAGRPESYRPDMAGRALIDWHSHVWLREHFTTDQASEMQDKVGALDAPPAAHRQAMAGVDRYLIIGVQWGAPHGPNVPNDFVAEQVAASGGRAIGFASVNPRQADAPHEFELAVREL